MRRFRKIKWWEGMVVVAVVAVVSATALPPNFRLSRLIYGDVDNSLPVAEVVPAELVPVLKAGKVEVVLLSREALPNHTHRLKFALINASDQPIFFTGYPAWEYQPQPPPGEINPAYHKQVLHLQKWEDGQVNWCGTGLEKIQSKPGYAGYFDAAIFGEEDGHEIRFGVHCTDHAGKPFTTDGYVWSSAIKRE